MLTGMGPSGEAGHVHSYSRAPVNGWLDCDGCHHSVLAAVAVRVREKLACACGRREILTQCCDRDRCADCQADHVDERHRPAPETAQDAIAPPVRSAIGTERNDAAILACRWLAWRDPMVPGRPIGYGATEAAAVVELLLAEAQVRTTLTA